MVEWFLKEEEIQLFCLIIAFEIWNNLEFSTIRNFAIFDQSA